MRREHAPNPVRSATGARAGAFMSPLLVSGLLLGLAPLAVAETPSVDQLYEMVKQLQANQEQLLKRLDRAEHEARTAQTELERTRAELARVRGATPAAESAMAPVVAPDPDLPGIVIGQRDGWAASFDGRVNAFMASISGDAPPTGANTDGVVITGDTLESDIDSFRVRTGFNPSALGLNLRAPDYEGNRIQARLGLYPSIQNNNLKNGRTDLDVREVYFAISREDWGELLFGRALSLYQRQHVILDMEGIGVGATGARGNGTTAGRVGFGYLYNNFAPSFRYTTPNMNGVQISVGLYDPSEIRGPEITVGAGNNVTADVTDVPRIETELTWELHPTNDSRLLLFGSGLWQKAEFDTNPALLGGARGNESVTAWGLGYGAHLQVADWDLALAGYDGQALGTSGMLDGNALDASGAERDHDGWYAQYRYHFTPRFGSGVAWGVSKASETAFDRSSGRSYIEEQKNWSAMGWFRLTDYVTFMAQYTDATTGYTQSPDQDNELFAIGAILSW